MGEAKRRKKLDPTFGSRDYVIEVNKAWDGWEILLNEELIDIVGSKEKADQIKEWLTVHINTNPLPKGRLHKDMIALWLFENINSFFDTDECEVLDFIKRLKVLNDESILTTS